MMKRHEEFPIGDFAEFARINRDTLVYYDKIKLFSPLSRGENDYRFYSNGQLETVNLIRTFKALGMSLSEISDLKDNRTPELVDSVLHGQIDKIDEKIQSWIDAKNLLNLLKTTIHSQIGIDENAITVKIHPAEKIILGEQNDYSNGMDDYGALYYFYKRIHNKYPDLNMCYPVWGLFSEERVRSGDWRWPDRYYFYNPEGQDEKPEALYITGYTRGGYGDAGGLFKRLLDYIDSNGYEICGPAYEEYPLNELCVSDDKNYLIRLMIPVRVM